MTTASLIRLHLALVAAASLPLPLWAATYKCTVDGKTVYQQTPCGPGVDGEAMRIQSAPAAGPAGAGDSARLKQQLEREGVRLAHDGFERLKSGRIDEYVANLCPRERQSYGNPSVKGSLKSEGERLAAGKVTLTGKPRDVGVKSLSFDAFHDLIGAGNSNTTPKKVRVDVGFGRDLGQLCLRGMSFWSGS